MSKSTNPYTLARNIDRKILTDIERLRTHHDEAFAWNHDVLNYLRDLQSSVHILIILHTEGKSVGID